MTRLTIRIDFDERGSFGPGKARLLELIAELASLRQAASAMEMSYRQAWLLIKAAEDSFGAPLVETTTGGTHGGGSRLTSLGETVLEHYRAIESKANRSAKREVAELDRLAPPRGTSASLPRKLRPRKRS